ncbi:FtsX-like permease family protein, partial [Actinomadura sp. LOL_011]|uniref:FtsX-like permease family protein n=1 Tax=Actinomadura sp. LOL_011 TaxID=3345410 RepID=UPI003A80BFE2
MTAYGPALRIVRRDALRAKGRTALIVCMIGLPVAAIVTLAVLVRTLEWSPREALPTELGAADARLTGAGHAPVRQTPESDAPVPDGERAGPADERPWTTGEIARRVRADYGPGARVLPMTRGVPVMLETSRGYLRADLTELDARDPLARGILDITEGRAPAAPDEIALAPSLGERGFPVGATVRFGGDGAARRVVGHVESPRSPGDPVALALPGTLPDSAADPASRHWLIDIGRSVTWDDVGALNRDGITVLSRDVVLDPPPVPDPPVPDVSSAGDESGGTAAVVAMAVAMIVLEVALLAGPAFAVGIRRRRRLLALVSVAGGEPRHLRAVVLAGGLVLGGAAAVGGALLGIGAAAVSRVVVDAVTDTAPGPFEVPWLPVVLTALLGAGSGLVAAYVPARHAARMDVVAGLAGRRDPGGARRRRGVPVAGAVLVLAGVCCCLFGVRALREYGAVFGAVSIIVGAVMVAPWLVGSAGRAGGALPVPLRLAVRDGARNHARTAPAVAAIMVAVAAMSALGIANTSDMTQTRMDYAAKLPEGSALIRPPADGAAEIREMVERELPGVPLVGMRVLAHENQACPAAGTSSCPFASFPDGKGEPGEHVEWHAVVGGAPVARLLLGRADPKVEAALAGGAIVLFGGADGAAGGTTTATVATWEDDRKRTLREVRDLPAIAARTGAHVRAIVPPSAAERIGLPAPVEAFGVDRAAHRLTEAEAERLEEILNAYPESGGVYVERGFNRSNATLMLVLTVVAAVLALGGALIVTGLSAADARPDLAVL